MIAHLSGISGRSKLAGLVRNPQLGARSGAGLPHKAAMGVRIASLLQSVLSSVV
jgi:hypothetical protein